MKRRGFQRKESLNRENCEMEPLMPRKMPEKTLNRQKLRERITNRFSNSLAYLAGSPAETECADQTTTGGYMTEAQRRMVIASEPDDITGEEGCGVEISGSSYRVARALERMGLGTYTHGSPYGDLYFNNREGMIVRSELLGESES